MLDAAGRADYRPNPRLARALDVLFLLHAEHELNCSTSAARHLASSGVDVYTAVMVRARLTMLCYLFAIYFYIIYLLFISFIYLFI